jgi:hypothetical protein
MSKSKFAIEKTKTGFSAYEVKYPIFSNGRTMHELQNNCFEATSVYL